MQLHILIVLSAASTVFGWINKASVTLSPLHSGATRLTAPRTLTDNRAMTTSLCEAAQKHYSGYSYYIPIRALSAAKAYDNHARLETFDMSLTGRIVGRMWAKLYLLLTWMDNLVRNKAILDAVKGVLSPNILCWQISLFIKNAYNPGFLLWHQCLTYWGLSEPDVCTSWVVLSPATLESGAKRVLPRTHEWCQVTHTKSFDTNNLLIWGQVVDAEIDEEQAVNLVLAPSEISLHHVRLVHASKPNHTKNRCIGLAIRYVTPHVRQVIGVSDRALLAGGEDRYGYFDEERSLVSESDPDAVAFHTCIIKTCEGFISSGRDNRRDN